MFIESWIGYLRFPPVLSRSSSQFSVELVLTFLLKCCNRIRSDDACLSRLAGLMVLLLLFISPLGMQTVALLLLSLSSPPGWLKPPISWRYVVLHSGQQSWSMRWISLGCKMHFFRTLPSNTWPQDRQRIFCFCRLQIHIVAALPDVCISGLCNKWIRNLQH